jgi:exonuclease SbcD
VIHEGQPPVVYAGSVDRIDFGEEKEAKGFVVAAVEKGRAEFEFVELASTRRFVTIEVRADGADPMVQVREAIAAQDITDSIVRLIIHTTADKSRLLQDSEIHALLGAAFRVATVVRDVERVSRLRLGHDQSIEQMTPLEVLERYLQVSRVSEDRIKKLLDCAQRVMHAES